MTRHHAKHAELRAAHEPTRWWERLGASYRDCPACKGHGLPEGCVECGQVEEEPYTADHAYSDYLADECRAYGGGE